MTKPLKTHRKAVSRPVKPEVSELSARDSIKRAAIQLFAVKGLDGTSTRDIAKESGLNLSLISYYFGGKEGLYKAVLHDFALYMKSKIDELVGGFEQRDITRQSIIETIHALIDIFIDIRREQPQMARIMTMEKIAGMPCGGEVHDQVFQDVGQRIESIILHGQKHGLIDKKINPTFFFSCLVEAMVGYFIKLDSETMGHDLVKKCYVLPIQREEFKKQMSLIFLEGIFK